jgi:hypothetical protein
MGSSYSFAEGYVDVIDSSKNYIRKKFNCELDDMEKGEKNEMIIDILDNSFWKNNDLFIDYETKGERLRIKRKLEILSLNKAIIKNLS